MGRTSRVHAEELSTDEAVAFWPRVLRVAPTYAVYQKATSRPIPLVRLVPVGQAGEQTMPSADSRDLFGNGKMSFIETGKVGRENVEV